VLTRRRIYSALAVAVVTLVAGTLLLVRTDRTMTGTAVPGPLSGMAMPVGDLPGWRQVFADDFDRTDLGENWSPYDGVPKGDPESRWRRANAMVDGQALILQGRYEGDQLTTAGLSNWRVHQTYGRWEIRVRVDASDDMTYAFLLWPQSENWPPEIDFLEDWGGDRQSGSANVHWKTDTGRSKAKRTLDADLTAWHTIGVEWLPGRLNYLIDGEPWASFTGSEVPDEPMWMAVQSAAGGCALRAADPSARQCPVAGNPPDPRIEIDWAVVYAPTDLPS
jgi:hypothetical protein